MTLPDALLQVRKRVWRRWQTFYKEENWSSQNRYYTANKLPRTKPLYTEHKLGATEMIIVAKIISGHVATKEVMKRWGLTEDDQCEKCQVAESLEHVLYECPEYEDSRRNVKEGRHEEWILSTRTNELRELVSFINETKTNV